MLDVVTGPFHPALEREFAGRLKAARADPLSPLVVVAPSRRLAARLKELAIEACPKGLAGVHFHNLTSLARELAGGEKGMRLVEDDLYHEKLLARLVREKFAEARFLPRTLAARGGARALLGAIKDLRDGGVDPADAINLVREGHLGGEDVAKVAELLSLHYRAAEALAERRVLSRADLARLAADRAARIAGAKVFAYGFYELVQGQIDLFRAVCRWCDVTLFYPLVEGDPDFAFAKAFFDDVVRGMASTRVALGRAEPVEPRGVAASGARDELWACAKWILETRERGVPFREIGVVARTLDPYADLLEVVFGEHAIPFTSSAARPAEREPAVVAARGLLDLADGGFRRDAVMELVASPYFRRDPAGDPAAWDAATRRMGIGQGAGEWRRRLLTCAGRDWVAEERFGPGFTLPAAQVGLLIGVVRPLLERAAPAGRTWGARAKWARDLVAEFIAGAGLLDEAFESVAALDEVLPPPAWPEFRETLRSRIAELSVPIGARNVPGVRVLDAMAARGLPFRALYVLGMNERVFPRYILEDPFVPDGAREQIRHRLGCRLPLKVMGYEEERLLFALLRDAARETLVLSWQRSDDKGRVQVPSVFLAGRPTASSLPKRPRERLRAVELSRLTPREAIVRAELAGEGGLGPAKALGALDGEALGAGLAFFDRIERAPKAGACDGAIGPVPEYWEALQRWGLSPTAMETYATCPFRFFAEKVLDLAPQEEPEEEEEANPLETGTIYHDVLKRHADGHPLEEALREGFEAFEETRTIRHPVLWKAERARIESVVRRFLDVDRATRGSFVPWKAEAKVEGTLAGIRFAGYVDRIDLAGAIDEDEFGQDEVAFRVIDYKRAKSRKFQALSMERGVFDRGVYVQPPLYFLLVAELLKKEGKAAVLRASKAGYVFLENVDDPREREMWLEGFSLRREAWLRRLSSRIEAIAAGDFVLNEDPRHCSWCDFATMCRKSHVPTRLRSKAHRRGEGSR